MKHLFTLIALISLLICLFCIGLTAMTMGSVKTIDLGQRGERTYSFSAQDMDFIYQGKLTTFDDRIGFKTEKHPVSSTGIEYDKQIRTATKTLPDATGFMLTVPAWYPIALFAILPIAWVVGAMRKKKKSGPGGFVVGEGETDEAPPTKGA
jgi:hypothetical protein